MLKVTSVRLISFISIFAVLVPAIAEAQLPSGAIMWLRSDTAVSIQKGRIAMWGDVSGHHNDAAQSDPAKCPYAELSSSGKPVVRLHGLDYMVAPSVFPCDHSYTVAGVVQLVDTLTSNNVLSGNMHALWFNSSRYLRVHHWITALDAVSSYPAPLEPFSFVASYNDTLGTVKMFINGLQTDSLWIPRNDDPAIYIGAYVGGYCLNGNIFELALYDKSFSPDEVTKTNEYFANRYSLSIAKPLPPGDSTFARLPQNYQFYARDADDSATVRIQGSIYARGFDSIQCILYRNEKPLHSDVMPLLYEVSKAPFHFEPRIRSDLAEYAVHIALWKAGKDSIIALRDSIVCGDAYLISGQSNALFGFTEKPYNNEYCRTLGVIVNHNARDTLWSIATSDFLLFGNSISAWGYEISHLLSQTYGIPICLLDGATPGGYIEWHLRNENNHTDLASAYGELLYRAQKGLVAPAIKAIIWDQGEWNTDYNYFDNFKRLYQAWHDDYSRLKKVYVIQIRPNVCEQGVQLKLKELQRHFQDSFPDVVMLANAAMPTHDGCHLHDSGWRVWGSQMYNLIARDFYGSSDTVDIVSPTLRHAYYTTSARDEIRLDFEPASCHLKITADTLVGSRTRTMKDYFFLDEQSGVVSSVRAQNNSLYLSVTNPNARSITYLPDEHYPDDTTQIYEGPWIVTTRDVGALIFYDVKIENASSNGVSGQANLSLRVADNPSNNNTNFIVSSEDSSTLTVYDALGRRHLYEAIPPSSRDYLISHHLPSGVYICMIETKSGHSQTLKLCVEE